MAPARSNAVQQATTYLRMGMREAATELLASAARKEPRNAEVAHLHAMVLAQVGRPADAVSELQRAVRIDPRSAVLRVTLGNTLAIVKRFDDAVTAYRAALELQPKSVGALLGLTITLMRVNDATGAVEAGREALRLAPDQIEPLVNLSTALKECGQSNEALDMLRRAATLAPQDASVLSLLLAAMNYVPQTTGEEIAATARLYGSLLPAEQPLPRPLRDRADHRLRVGYLSADFREHSVAAFIEPILRHHDHTRFEVLAYSDVRSPDHRTGLLQSFVRTWRDVRGLSDAGLVEQIRQDHVDILVELAGHTRGHRLAALALRAAPLQASYLGYPATTGVAAIDARIVDRRTDPPQADQHATERLVRLDECFVCYQPSAEAPDISTPPFERNGFVTFGSFNSMPKITDSTLQCWAVAMANTPDSRLLLKNRSLGDPRLQRSIREHMERLGVAGERVQFESARATQVDHLAMYGQIDIAIDTFPYNGTTTTCEALWMGVPVVTFPGSVHAARVSASLLHAADLHDLIAENQQAWVVLAASLAQDRHRLRGLRRTLRERVRTSRLCAGEHFTRGFETSLQAAFSARAAQA